MESAAPRRAWVVPAAVAMVVVHLGLRAWALYGSWFRFDDANFVSYLSGNDLSAKVALTGYDSHLMPGAFVLTWLNGRLGTLAWAYPATELLVLQAIADIGAVVLLVSAFGRRPGILAPLAVFLFTVIGLPAAISWGPGITQLPFLCALVWGSVTHLQYLRTRRFPWAIATMAITVAALLFGEKTLLIFWVYAFLALAYFASGDIVARLRTVARRYTAGVVLYSAVVVAHLAWYVATALNFDPGDSTEQPLLPLIGNLVGSSWATGVLGGPLRWDFPESMSAGLARPGQLVALVAVALLVCLYLELSRTRLRSGRAWVLVALVLLSDVVALAGARAVFAGPQIALLYRYLTEMSAVTMLALGLASMPLRGAVETVEPRERPVPSAFIDRPWRVAAAVATVVVLGTWSSVTYIHHWHTDTRTEDYFATAKRSLGAMPQPVPIADGPVPDWLILGLAFPDNMVSHVLHPYRAMTTYPQVASDSLYVIAPDGSVQPAVVDPVRRNVPASTGGCPYPARNGSVTIPLTGPAIGTGWWVRIGYFTTDATPVQISAGDERHETELKRGLHSVFFQAGADRFDEIRLDGIDRGAGFCATDLQLGRTRPFQATAATSRQP